MPAPHRSTVYFVVADLVTIQQHMTDGSPKSGLPVDLVGTLQAAGGVKGASTGHPVLSQPSPASLLEGNCIHANSKGFTAIFDALWDVYFSRQ